MLQLNWQSYRTLPVTSFSVLKFFMQNFEIVQKGNSIPNPLKEDRFIAMQL